MDVEEKTTTPQAGLDEFAYFGYRPVAAAEKEKLVHQHFDTVSARYDFMNTLLSFGLHHPWKRTAVRLMGLKAGDRVLDVCGGTADLALLAAKQVGARRPGAGLRHQPGHDGGRPAQGGPGRPGLPHRLSPGGRRTPLLPRCELRRGHGGFRHPQPDPPGAGFQGDAPGPEARRPFHVPGVFPTRHLLGSGGSTTFTRFISCP